MRMTVDSSQKAKAVAPAPTASSTASPAGLRNAETTPALKFSPSEAA